MNLRFLKEYEGDEELGFVSFWCEPIRYDFEISCADNEDLDLYEKEFKLNVKNQIEGSFFKRLKK